MYSLVGTFLSVSAFSPVMSASSPWSPAASDAAMCERDCSWGTSGYPTCTARSGILKLQNPKDFVAGVSPNASASFCPALGDTATSSADSLWSKPRSLSHAPTRNAADEAPLSLATLWAASLDAAGEPP